jgi:hypothetical protein
LSTLLLNPTHEAQIDEGASTRTALASAILESAATHHHHASDKRIGAGPSKLTGLTTGSGLSQFRNLSKARAIQEERKAKKAEAQRKDVGIKIVATVWMADGNKLTQVSIMMRRALEAMA